MKLTDVIKPGRIIFRGRTYTPDEVRANIDDLARHLSTILPPDKPFVYLSGVNHAKFIFAYFAIIKAGHICVIVDPKTGPIEYGEYLEKVSPAAVIKINCDTMEWDLVGEIKIRDNGAEYTDELDDVCTMIFHAADDGYAKALMLTNRSIYADAKAHADTNQSSASSLVCALVPFCHLYSLTVGIVVPFLSNAGLIVLSANERGCFQAFSCHRPTHLYSVPVTFHFMLKEAKSLAEDVRGCIFNSGGYTLPFSTFEHFREMFGGVIRNGYGLSEASPVCTWNHLNDAVNPQSVGTAFSCCKLRVAPADCPSLPPGTEGEVLVAGENVFKGYYKDPVASMAILSDGWLHTRDIGYIDEKGYLFLAGNTRRMLNVTGKKVFPAEVERLIGMHKNVEKVHVYGVWNEATGHSVKAEVSFKKPAEEAMGELRDWCRLNLSPSKIPHFHA